MIVHIYMYVYKVQAYDTYEEKGAMLTTEHPLMHASVGGEIYFLSCTQTHAHMHTHVRTHAHTYVANQPLTLNCVQHKEHKNC